MSVAICTQPIIVKPKTIKVALSKPHWLSVMHKKIQVLRSNDIWTLVPQKPIMNGVDT